MAEEEANKVVVEEPEPVKVEAPAEAVPVDDSKEEKSVSVTPPPPPPVDDSKALAIVEKAPDPEPVEDKGSVNRDAVLARVETEKRASLVIAWEESEKSKAENKAHRKISAIAAWENSKKATVEAELKKMEEKLEKIKAGYIEKMKNKVALIHKEAEEKRAMIEAKRGEDLLKAEEIAAKYRATGTAPKKIIGCLG